MRRLGVAGALALAVLAGARAMAQDVRPFVVGVWGEGGTVVPFADFDGRQWRSSWPAPVATAPDPEPLERVPAAWWGRSTFQPTWEVVDASGGRREVEITATGVARLGSGCSSSIALETNVPANTYAYGTALATSRPGVVDAVQILTPDTADWRTLSALLPGLYRQHEAAAWREVSEDFRPDMNAPLTGPRLVAAFISIDALGQYAYFESSREFAPRRDQRGGYRSFITGWLWRRSPASSFQAVSIRAATNDTDGKGPASFRPLGIVRQGAQRFWLGMLDSYAYHAMTVFDVRRAGVQPRLRVDYSGC